MLDLTRENPGCVCSGNGDMRYEYIYEGFLVLSP